MLSIILAAFRMYLTWMLLSLLAWPLLRWLGLRAFEGWIATRVISPFAFALVLMHVLRWGAVGWSAGLFWGVFALCSAGSLWISRKLTGLHGVERKALVRFEGFVLLFAALLTIVFGFHYGNHALGERPLDLGLVSSLSCVHKFPPPDFWFAGRRLNTYYLGSWTVASLGRGAFMIPYQAYFFGLVVVWLQAFGACVLAGRTLGMRGRALTVVPLVVLVMSNGAFIYQWLRGNELFSVYPLIRLARIIPYTINENPSIALWVSELHAHVMVLSLFVMWVVAVSLALRRRTFRLVPLCGFLAAALAITDAWQVLPAALCAILLALAEGRKAWIYTLKAFWVFLGSSLLIGFAFLLDYQRFPFRFLPLEVSNTELTHFLVLFGPLLVIITVALVGGKQLGVVRRTGVALIAAALCLVAFCEFFYIDTQIPYPGERQNTVFRFHYAAWVLLGIAVGAFWPKRFRSRRFGILVWGTILFFVIGGVIPLFSHLIASPGRWTCDVRQSLDAKKSGRLEVAQWMYVNTPSHTVIAESAGHPYRRFGTISAMSGRIALLGEFDKIQQHAVEMSQIRWRLTELQVIYGGYPQAEAILDNHNVDYIILGPKELEAYPKSRTDLLLKKYRTVFSSGETLILKVERKTGWESKLPKQ